MISALEHSTSSSSGTRSTDERKQSPPAFLDLADSAARLGTNMTDLSARVELKRIEHERQRLLQRKMFEDQMRMLEQQQAQELLSIPVDSSSLQHLAASAPTTPPRINASLDSDYSPEGLVGPRLSPEITMADKRKSVTYGATISLEPGLYGPAGHQNSHSSFSRAAGAKSMPASRRTSASEHDEDLAEHLQGLSMMGNTSTNPGTPAQSIARKTSSRFGDDVGNGHYGAYNAGMLLDEQLDKEMHNAMLNLPTYDDDKYHSSYSNKLSTASAALDLAPLSQTPPRNSFTGRGLEAREKSSEWPQFTGPPRGPDGLLSRNDRGRNATNPTLAISSSLSGTLSASATPLLQQHTPGSSRRSSPSGMLDTALSSLSGAHSVPATPFAGMPNSGPGGRQDHVMHLGKKSSATTLTMTESQGANSRVTSGALGAVNAGDLHASLSRIPAGQYDNQLNFSSIQSGLDEAAQYGVESIYGLEDDQYNSYGFESGDQLGANANGSGGSTALYHHHGSRYGLGMGNRINGADSKMNGLHGPKHKRGDMDREFNRFAGTRLEDLQGEIPNLCKDQHGCRYLQKKLEEAVPEHRDIIFRETFGHFAELMTDPFGNYLCQKLLEYSTDDQRNVICESVAQDLVNISLNMHGTRAVQKMIDFLSTQRQQADVRYDAQIHSIIVALSLHVVVLIKDLNGNHVIQKCLNKLAPEDNQFIYNAVAANCVEVATHRHGCCVLQRCIDHASDHQRVQLVNEITYNALTLVQDPYGNYVVQYILDLNDNRFSDAVIRQFTGNVCALSVQKFSSNVIEKCIRVAEHNTRKLLIEELLNRTRLEKLLRDSFGNYCVQTALDYAEPQQRALLVEGIRPILPLIRNTPYGKRIQSKLQREQMELASAGGHYVGYHPQQALVLSNQSLGHNQSRHMSPQSLHSGNPLAELYGQNSLYTMGHNGSALLHGQQSVAHTPHLHHQQMHALPHHPIDGYVLQGNSSHNQALTTSHIHGNNSFAGMTGFANSFGSSVGLGGNINDPYQRTSFGYGM